MSLKSSKSKVDPPEFAMLASSIQSGNGTAAQEYATHVARTASIASLSVAKASNTTQTHAASTGQTFKQLSQQTAALRAHFVAGAIAPPNAAPPPKDPRQSPGGSVTQSGSNVVIDTSDKNDKVSVTRDTATGDVSVTVNGTEHRFTASQAEHITVRAHGGDDEVRVDPDVQINVTVAGGDGNDSITGGGGADTLDGGAGDDTIVGGNGSDKIVAAAGDDTVDAGAGNDTVDGGEGADTVKTGDGDDAINGGAGDDKIDSEAGRDTVNAGAGDDRVRAGEGNDTVDGGEGDDYVDGATGHDTLRGSNGADTLYGGDGDDIVDGGAGKDYLDGYLGDDVISGGDGDDVISGGQGGDTLFGDQGNDIVYTGKGRDFVGDLDGTNTVYYQGEDSVVVNQATRDNAKSAIVEVADVPDNIVIEGSPEFQARMRADLETLAASPTGQHMLKEIDKQGDGWRIFGGDNKLTIRELDIENGKGGGQFGGDGYAEINPAFHLDGDDGRVPPIAVLYHELGHARAAMSDNWAGGEFHDDADPSNPDTGINNAERQAVGLTIDHDNDPTTPAIIDPNTPAELTENAIRAEMGYGPREDYS
jgi:Ca2+-binding RTX toxin-like protein